MSDGWANALPCPPLAMPMADVNVGSAYCQMFAITHILLVSICHNDSPNVSLNYKLQLMVKCSARCHV